MRHHWHIYIHSEAKNTVKPVLVATSIMQATCIKRLGFQFSVKTNKYKCTCIKQALALIKQALFSYP